jgi:hypothetical protein
MGRAPKTQERTSNSLQSYHNSTPESRDVSGATIAHGMLFVNSGYSVLIGMPGNVMLALSIDGK